jgi:hypothetical protein
MDGYKVRVKGQRGPRGIEGDLWSGKERNQISGGYLIQPSSLKRVNRDTQNAGNG